MARGTSLGELVTKVRIAAKRDPNPALSLNAVDQMKQLIREEQERLYDEFDWPFLKITRDKILEAGSRYYDVPADMDLERIKRVDVLHGGRWLPVERGISLNHYNAHDSDDDARTDPVLKWDVKDVGAGAQIEVWPIPATDGIALRFTGIRKLRPLVANDDVADLDDQMIVNYVAAELLADDESAKIKLAKAKARKETLQGRVMKTRSNTLSFAHGFDERREPRTPLVARAS